MTPPNTSTLTATDILDILTSMSDDQRELIRTAIGPASTTTTTRYPPKTIGDKSKIACPPPEKFKGQYSEKIVKNFCIDMESVIWPYSGYKTINSNEIDYLWTNE